MLFDLPTLLALRVGVDVLIAAAFWGMQRRMPAIPGPRWWACASLIHIAATASLVLRSHLPAPWILPLSNLLFTGTFVCVWLGFRRHVGLPVRFWPVATGFALLWLGYLILLEVHDRILLRQLLWSTSSAAVLILFMRDAVRMQPSPNLPEYRFLRWVNLAELVGLGFYAVIYLVLQWPFLASLPILIFWFTLTSLLRALACNGLVVYRLRHDGERATARLRQSEADLRLLVDNLSAGVIVFKPDRTPHRMNAAARRFMGWSDAGAEEALLEPNAAGWQLVDEGGQPMRRHDMPFERVLATGQPVHHLVVGVPVLPDGQVRWAFCNAYPENDVQGGLRQVVLTFIDITELKAAQAGQQALQERLAQSQKMQALGTLAGGVAHDFNNILAAILGNAELALDDLPAQSRARESLGEIGTAARRGRELVRQILAFSRQQPLERARLEMPEVVAESCALLRAALPPQVQLVQTASGLLPPVCGDATQLQQVLVNLGTNALHAMQGRSGRIEFAVDTLPPDHPDLPAELARACAAAHQGAVRLRVSDDGCGMDEALRARIFEPFFTTKPVGQGTGLGLPVVLGIVEAHGGHIEVTSQPGAGSTFTLLFPPAAAEPATATGKPVTMNTVEPNDSPARPQAADGDAPHILYLDDDDTLVFLVRRLLERRGYRVTALSMQDEAIGAVRDNPGRFALLLTDFNMPGKSGIDVAREVLALDPSLTVAVASGYITDELQAEAKAAGVREVVFKTDAVDQFCEIVARLVKTGPA